MLTGPRHDNAPAVPGDHHPIALPEGPSSLLAFEMALSDSTERALLDLQLSELEARWEEAEEIAAIADGS